MLLPDRNEVAGLLARYRAQELEVLADPVGQDTWKRFESTAYTLCVLMGKRTALGAVEAAERYVVRPRAGRPSLQDRSLSRRQV